MASPQTPGTTSGIRLEYATVFEDYVTAGWPSVLPLPPGQKAPPPKGWTGEGPYPSFPDMFAWSEDDRLGGKAGANVALRMPPTVIGIDVDAYGQKSGAITLRRAEEQVGPLPATWRSSARPWPSGIRFYRVPAGVRLRGQLGPGVEIVQRHHRYAVVWPSMHPEGTRYEWHCPQVETTVGLQADQLRHELPRLDGAMGLRIAELPAAWVEHLREEVAVSMADPASTPTITSWVVALDRSAQPCARMGVALELAIGKMATATKDGGLHDVVRDAVWHVCLLATEGHTGLRGTLAELMQAFSSARELRGERHGIDDAPREWRDILGRAVAKLGEPAELVDLECSCGWGETEFGQAGTQADSGQATEYGTLAAASLAAARSADAAAELEGDGPEAVMAFLDGVMGDAPVSPAAVMPTLMVAPSGEYQPPTPGESWRGRRASDIAASDAEPAPSHLLRGDGAGLLYSGRVNGILGESESGKTWVALWAATQALSAGQRVLYLDFEDSDKGVVRRLRDLGATGEQLQRFVYTGPSETLSLPGYGNLLADVAGETYGRPDLIILDGYNAAMEILGLDLMSNKDVATFNRRLLAPLVSLGACVVYIDHVTKSSEGRGKGGIGAQHKRSATTGCTLSVSATRPFGRGQTGHLKITVDKDRAGLVREICPDSRYVGTLVFQSDAITGEIRMTLPAPTKSDENEEGFGGRPVRVMERIIEHLKVSGAMTTSQIRGSGVGDRSRVPAALEALLADGIIRQEPFLGRGGKGFNYALTQRYLDSVNEDNQDTK